MILVDVKDPMDEGGDPTPLQILRFANSNHQKVDELGFSQGQPQNYTRGEESGYAVSLKPWKPCSCSVDNTAA